MGGKGGQGGEIGTNKSSSVKMCGGGGLDVEVLNC